MREQDSAPRGSQSKNGHKVDDRRTEQSAVRRETRSYPWCWSLDSTSQLKTFFVVGLCLWSKHDTPCPVNATRSACLLPCQEITESYHNTVHSANDRCTQMRKTMKSTQKSRIA